MPTLSTFYSIIILMYFDDHNPPHFHVRYAGSKAIVDIETLKIIGGSLPARAERFVAEWATDHRSELRENWDLCTKRLQPKPIAPLP